jgi:hypothetical protein
MRLALRARTRPVVKEDSRDDPNTRFRPHSVSKRAREIVRQALDKLRASRAVIVSPSAYRQIKARSRTLLCSAGRAPVTKRLGYLFIGCAQAGALRFQRGIILIRLRPGLLRRFWFRAGRRGKR